MPPNDTRVGLALSGGGFRATLYHCGALLRLNELGQLPKIDRITSVSGGSITAGRLAVAWDRLAFDASGKATRLTEEVIEPLRAFCRRRLDVSSIVAHFLPFGKDAVGKLIQAYDELFEEQTLDRLPARPHFIFKATNLQTGRQVRFSRRRVAEWRLGEIADVSGIQLAQAVAASSAFPPILSPVKLPVADGAWSLLEGADLFGNADYAGPLQLTDGGVYDNLGLERIDHFGTILCSDAGAPFNLGGSFKAFSFKQVMRALNIATDQSRGLRKRRLFDLSKLTGQTVVYWGIDQRDTESPPPDILPHDHAVTASLAKIRTRLNPFSEEEQSRLINWGYASCDERMRRYLMPQASPPTALPKPDWPLTREV